MSRTAGTPRLFGARCSMPTASRRSPLSEHKTAHRDLSVLCNIASAPTRSQAPIASAENARCVTIARRTPLLPHTSDCSTPGVMVCKPQTPQTACEHQSAWGKAAEILKSTSEWSSRAAIVSGGAALVTSETGVGGIAFGTIAAGAETVSLVTNLGAAGAQLFDRDYRGLTATLASTAVGFIVPIGLQRLSPAVTDSGQRFGQWLANAEGDLASQATEAGICP